MNELAPVQGATEIALLPTADLTAEEVFKGGGVDDLLARIAAMARAQKHDVSTRAGRQALASLALKIAKSKVVLDDMGKDFTAELKKRTGAVDAERRRIREFLDSLKEEVRAPLTAWETAEAERKAAHENALRQLTAPLAYGAMETAAQIAERRHMVEQLYAREWEEYAPNAKEAYEAEVPRLQFLHEAALKREAEAAELQRLRAEAAAAAEEKRQREAAEAQAKREARIAAEAAERAAREAEEKVRAEKLAAERLAIEAEEKLKRVEAEKAAAVEAEKRRAAAEQQKAAEEARRAEEEARRRAADVEHRRTINHAVAAALMEAGEITEEQARAIVGALARGKIPHTAIAY